jgi:hypothetical protein
MEKNTYHDTRKKGIDCHRCGMQTIMLRHRQITPELLNKKAYYEFWYLCVNDECPTTLIMPPEGKVFNSTR